MKKHLQFDYGCYRPNYDLPAHEKYKSINWQTDVLYTDIESNGLRQEIGNRFKITSIANFDGSKLSHYVNSKKLKYKHLSAFKTDIQKYKAVVTFNGEKFDLVQTAKQLKVDWSNHIHFDLRWIFAQFLKYVNKPGSKGGYKGLKKDFDISNPVLQDLDGDIAKYLWQLAQQGNQLALKVLIAYNTEDIVPMAYLMQVVRNKVEIQMREALNSVEEEQAALAQLKKQHQAVLCKIKQKNKEIMTNLLKQLKIDRQIVVNLIGQVRDMKEKFEL